MDNKTNEFELDDKVKKCIMFCPLTLLDIKNSDRLVTLEMLSLLASNLDYFNKYLGNEMNWNGKLWNVLL